MDVSDLTGNFLKGLYHWLGAIYAIKVASGALTPHLTWMGFPAGFGLPQLCQPFSPVPLAGEQPGCNIQETLSFVTSS